MKRLIVTGCLGMVCAWVVSVAAFAQGVAALENFGTLKRVYRIDNLYVAGQPDVPTLNYFKNRGGKTVINLRDPAELAFDEEGTVRNLGLRYFNFPVPKNRELNASTLLAVSWAIEKEGRVPILMHCSSGNRAASALAVHLLRIQNLDNPAALAVAEQAGLNKPGARKKLEALLKEGVSP